MQDAPREPELDLDDLNSAVRSVTVRSGVSSTSCPSSSINSSGRSRAIRSMAPISRASFAGMDFPSRTASIAKSTFRPRCSAIDSA
jgi:hypothetical protein